MTAMSKGPLVLSAAFHLGFLLLVRPSLPVAGEPADPGARRDGTAIAAPVEVPIRFRFEPEPSARL